MRTGRSSMRAFRVFAWATLLYNLAVIVWGAFVRATGSGAGCGDHWPLCNGTAIPQSPTLKTVIEFSHRVTSGLAVALAVGLVIFAFRMFPRWHLARRAAVAALFFEFMEAVIGAAIVLLGHVAKNPSIARGYSLSAHLVNTLLLIAALTLTVWASYARSHASREHSGVWRAVFALAFAALLFLGVSGTIAALGDTLFPASSLSEGFRQDFAAGAHPFIRLRIWHPAIAVAVAIGLGALSLTVITRTTVITRNTVITRTLSRGAVRMAFTLVILVLMQLGVGLLNLSLLAPIPLQLFHLLMAEAVWIVFILLAAEVLLQEQIQPAIHASEPITASAR